MKVFSIVSVRPLLGEISPARHDSESRLRSRRIARGGTCDRVGGSDLDPDGTLEKSEANKKRVGKIFGVPTSGL